MPDNQVEIVFKTTAELQGAIAAQNELEKTRGKLLALGKDTVEVDAQLARANQLISQAPAGMVDAAKMEEGAAGFQKLNLHGREFHKLLHEISATSPGAGLALRGLINPATAGFFGLLIAVKAFHEKFKEAEATLKMGGTWENFSKVLAKQSEDFDSATLSADAYARKLDETRTATDRLKTATENEIAIIQARAREEDAERSAELAEKKAEVDAKRKAGVIDEVQALKEKNDLENRFGREKIDREEKAAREVIGAMQKEREGVRAAMPEAHAAAAGAERALLLAETPGTRKEREERARLNVKAAEEAQKQAEAGTEGLAGVLSGGAGEKRLENARASLEAANAALKMVVAGTFEVVENFAKLKEASQRANAYVEELERQDKAIGQKVEQSYYRDLGAGASRRRVEATEEKTRMVGLIGEAAPQFAKNLAGISPSPFSGTRDEGGGQPSAAQRAVFQQMGISMSDAMVPLILQATKDAVEAAKRRTEQLLSVGKATQN